MHLLFELSGVKPPSVLEKDASFIGSFRASKPVRTLDPAARSIMTGPQRAVNRAQTMVDRAGATLGRGADRALSGFAPRAAAGQGRPSVSLESGPPSALPADGLSAPQPQVTMRRTGSAPTNNSADVSAPAHAGALNTGTVSAPALTAPTADVSGAGSMIPNPPSAGVAGAAAGAPAATRTRMQRASDWAWNNPKSTAALMGLGGVAVPAAGYGAYQGLKEDPWYTQAFNRITGR
jgi:hypothetical protein